MEEEGLEEGQEVVGCKSAGSRWGCAPGRRWGRWKWVDSRSILQVESTRLTEGRMCWGEGAGQASTAQAAGCRWVGRLLR